MYFIIIIFTMSWHRQDAACSFCHLFLGLPTYLCPTASFQRRLRFFNTSFKLDACNSFIISLFFIKHYIRAHTHGQTHSVPPPGRLVSRLERPARLNNNRTRCELTIIPQECCYRKFLLAECYEHGGFFLN